MTDYEYNKNVPEDEALPDEIQAIAEAKADKSPTISHDEIDWN